MPKYKRSKWKIKYLSNTIKYSKTLCSVDHDRIQNQFRVKSGFKMVGFVVRNFHRKFSQRNPSCVISCISWPNLIRSGGNSCKSQCLRITLYSDLKVIWWAIRINASWFHFKYVPNKLNDSRIFPFPHNAQSISPS